MLRTVDASVAPPTPRAYRFAGFRLDLAHRVLTRGSHAVRLPERIFQVLLMLVEANGQVVARADIARRVWRGGGVAGGNIAQHVYLLRRRLGEHARDRGLVMAVNGQGYRLTVPVVVDTGDARGVEPAEKSVDEFVACCEDSCLVEPGTARALRRAIEVFEASLRRPLDRELALVGLARAYAILARYSFARLEELAPFREIVGSVGRTP